MPNGDKSREIQRFRKDKGKVLSLQKITEGAQQTRDRGEGTSEGVRLHARENVLGLGPDIAASDPALTEQYTFLLDSADFRFLDKMVNCDEKITLVASPDIPGQRQSYGQQIYDPQNHQIHIPLKEDGIAKSPEDIREMILFEMHNAKMRNAFRRIDTILRFMDKSDPYKRAAYTLACEWQEWINLLEHDIRCQSINVDINMKRGIICVKRVHDLKYAQPDKRWYNFHKYLEDQIKAGHTVYFDPNAADSSWVGKRLLAVAKKRFPNSFIISPEQVQNWQTGGRMGKIKSPFDNPFCSTTVIEQARTKPRQVIPNK